VLRIFLTASPLPPALSLHDGQGAQGLHSENSQPALSEVGGSVRDVQQLAGHASLQTTQRYIEGDTDAKRKLVQLI